MIGVLTAPTGERPAVASEPQRDHIGPPMASEGVGDRLRRFRRLRRLSQEQLSEQSGVRRDYIAQLERGATAIPRDPDNLKLLAAALKIRLRDLAEPIGWYDDEKAPADEDWPSLLMNDDRLDDEGRRFLERAIRLEFEAAQRRNQPEPERKKRAG